VRHHLFKILWGHGERSPPFEMHCSNCTFPPDWPKHLHESFNDEEYGRTQFYQSSTPIEE
jgi:hypothetical protein